ncbi:MAG: MFS transporter [Spirochaetaceae bacterium]|nr:MAG: MFS transporter [Spirochaetaceae bacterium]
MPRKDNALPLKVKVGFGICDLGGNLFFTIMGFYLLFFLTDVVGLRAGLAGTALMIGKLWDAVSDPAVGYLSDRTSSRWGRRRPYIFVGAITLFLSMIWVFTPVRFDNQLTLFGYVALVYCILNTTYTLVNIPYGALTPELTEDFDERTVLNGYRMVFAVVGTFIGAATVLPLVQLGGGSDAGWTIMGGVMGAIMMGTALVTFFTVREQYSARVAERINVIRSYLQVLKMKPFLTALIPWSLHITGINIIQAGLLYYFGNIYGDESGFLVALPLLLLSSIIFIPIWVKISERIGKKRCYNIGMLIFAASIIVFFFLGHILGMQFSFVIMFVAGIGFATQYVMPYSMVPDIVEYDYSQTGIRREGVFYGMWTFVSKTGQAFGIALTGWVLSAFGYREPSVLVPDPLQTDAARLGIRLLTGPIPATFFVAGVIVLSFYPITRARYNEIIEIIRRREAEASGDAR